MEENKEKPYKDTFLLQIYIQIVLKLVLLSFSNNPLKFSQRQYQRLRPPGLLHLPSNGQWGALLHKCKRETQPEVAGACDGLECAR